MSRFPVIPFLPSENITPSRNGFICEISTKICYKLKSLNFAIAEHTITTKMQHAQKKLAARGAWNNLANKIFEYLNNLGDDVVLN